ncbi:MAG: radical SAM protein [Polyangiaceae bacterium]
MARENYEEPRVLALLAATLAAQQPTLASWGVGSTGVRLVMNACESRCFFCANPGVTNPPPSAITPWSELERWLEENRSLRLRRLCLVGTEPARHPDFERLLERARDVGFEELELMTSGLRLAEPGEAERWAERGVVTIASPLYAEEAELHDQVVGHAAFERTVAGLSSARAAGIEVRVHTLALRRTLGRLPRLAAFVRERFGTRLALAPVRPKEQLFDYAREVPSWDALEAALDGEPDLSLVGFPLCLAPHVTRGAATSIELYFRGQARRWLLECEPCAERERCGGVLAAELVAARVRPR